MSRRPTAVAAAIVSAAALALLPMSASAQFFSKRGAEPQPQPQPQPVAESWPPVIERVLPPLGIEVAAEVRSRFEAGLEEFSKRAQALRGHADFADVEVFAKALRYAINLGEFYSEKDFAAGDKALELAMQRLAFLEKGETPWAGEDGLLVRGYRSSIDDSVQPYGLHIPDGLDRTKPAPVLIWLHGRGDKSTDLHFIRGCLSKNSALGGHFDAENVITVHPFGRQCVGWKHAGEIDVLDVIEEVKRRYNIDADRVALAGFSMGGAGVWHIGAHYADQFCAVHAGAGFAETAQYNNLTPEQYPPDYEQTLWGLYDVPNYTRNLFNVPVLAYSGEEDKQKQAADLMAQAFAREGRELTHLIGPGMGHKYHPEVVKEVQAYLLDAMHRGRDTMPAKVSLQTRTLRYPKMHWVTATGLKEHWLDSRVEAELIDDGLLQVTTKNVTGLRLDRPFPKGAKILIDGQEVVIPEAAEDGVQLVGTQQMWRLAESPGKPPVGRRKRPGLQGTIDDAFLSPFLVVTPSGKSSDPLVQRWVEFELAHFQQRWKALMRGELRIKPDSEVTAEDIANYNLILWGDSDSNSVIAENSPSLPSLGLGPSTSRVATMIYPNPQNPEKYLVLNSGLTLREAHDRTNSLQNPKLPDWAVIGLDQAPDGSAPGKILEAGFFDESWLMR